MLVDADDLTAGGKDELRCFSGSLTFTGTGAYQVKHHLLGGGGTDTFENLSVFVSPEGVEVVIQLVQVIHRLLYTWVYQVYNTILSEPLGLNVLNLLND